MIEGNIILGKFEDRRVTVFLVFKLGETILAIVRRRRDDVMQAIKSFG